MRVTVPDASGGAPGRGRCDTTVSEKNMPERGCSGMFALGRVDYPPEKGGGNPGIGRKPEAREDRASGLGVFGL